MTSRKPVRLRLLGATDLDGARADLLLTGSKRLALVAYLALARPRGFQRRDTLLALLWPDLGQAAGRNALSNLLHHVRRAMGSAAAANRGTEEVGLEAEAVWVDAVAFEEAIASGAWEAALDLYRGPLLEGFSMRGAAPEFEDWLDRERERLRSIAADAARSLSNASGAAGDLDAARTWARRATDLDPLSEASHRRLLNVLAQTGDRGEALATHAAFARRLDSDLGVTPSEITEAAVARVRALPEAATGGPASGPTGLDPRCLVVLPFQSVGGESEPFATGLHLDVLSTLARDPSLTVISRGSALRAHRGGGSPEAAARAVGAGTLLEGTVRESAGQVRLTVQLVDVRDVRVRWAETVDCLLSASAVFDLQAELAARIVATVQGELSASEVAPRPPRGEHGNRPSVDLDAYLLQTRGRVHLEQRTERGVRRALHLFSEAKERDPDYASAWAGLAEARALLDYYGYDDPNEEAARALGAALRALEQDPTSGEALMALGIVRASRHEGPAAVRAFRQSVALTPGLGEAHCWLGWAHLLLGEPAAAVAPSERAAELDPLAPAVLAYLAEAYLANGRVGESAEVAHRAWAAQPDYAFAHYIEGVALYHMERFGEAAFALSEARVLARVGGAPDWRDVEGVLAVTRGAAGDTDGLQALLHALQEERAGVPMALALTALGDVDGALDALETVDVWTPVTTVQVRYLFPDLLKPIRAHPRFAAVLDGLDAAWRRPVTPSP